MSDSPRDVTRLLHAWTGGDPKALDQLVPLVYAELRSLAHRFMRGEVPNHSLQGTALVHETYLRLAGPTRLRFESRTQFLAICARTMRQILVDAAREQHAQKRGGGAAHVPLDEDVPGPDPAADLLAVDQALAALAAVDPRPAQVVALRYFGGLTVEETADVMQISTDTVTRDWQVARLWLWRELRGPGARRGER
jgi:RNA polymerase sigma-70 factor, ECF subfamily